MPDLIHVSRRVSQALRHDPQKLGIELDEDGWVSIADLVEALQAAGEPGLRELDIVEMVRTSTKKRHEIRGAHIRAAYGHSAEVGFEIGNAEPPTLLFHGTNARAMESIRGEGLLPMSRKYVHLSTDLETAIGVASRRTDTPIVLAVDARDAWREGVQFAVGEEHIWMSGPIPVRFIHELTVERAPQG